MGKSYLDDDTLCLVCDYRVVGVLLSRSTAGTYSGEKTAGRKVPDGEEQLDEDKRVNLVLRESKDGPTQ